LAGFDHLRLGANPRLLLGIELDPQRLEVGRRALSLDAQFRDGTFGRPRPALRRGDEGSARSAGAGRCDKPGERAAEGDPRKDSETDLHPAEGSLGPLQLARVPATLPRPWEDRLRAGSAPSSAPQPRRDAT
jgi:hypothetical protein